MAHKRYKGEPRVPQCTESAAQCWVLDRLGQRYAMWERELTSLVLELASNAVPVRQAAEPVAALHRVSDPWCVDWRAASPSWVTRRGVFELLPYSEVFCQAPLRNYECSRCAVRLRRDVYPIAPDAPSCIPCASCGLWICIDCAPAASVDTGHWYCASCETIPYRFCRICDMVLRAADHFGLCSHCGGSYCGRHLPHHVCVPGPQ